MRNVVSMEDLEPGPQNSVGTDGWGHKPHPGPTIPADGTACSPLSRKNLLVKITMMRLCTRKIIWQTGKTGRTDANRHTASTGGSQIESIKKPFVYTLPQPLQPRAAKQKRKAAASNCKSRPTGEVSISRENHPWKLVGISRNIARAEYSILKRSNKHGGFADFNFEGLN